ncbi:MAG: Na/Pi cotransporter family protein [Alphaproteobacteria bacterium]|nr:Na/Pi cotransporter family protein [Alphaproteobacteria bacterium]NCQ87624.1 Na/Pi cotransporter family protein [Alphaproteobacteria bacterium]NCT05867.1 Na/Pi cotransporter family protein [Alphaproteobacteria bacterium]
MFPIWRPIISPTFLLINIIAGVCLLLWGVALLRLGVTRGFGAGLRAFLSKSTDNRVKAMFAGIGMTTVLQSSTATVLIVAAFAGQGLIGASAGLAVILGADIGTTLVAQLFSFDLSWIAPVFMIIGFFLFKMEKSGKLKNTGRIFIGLALMLVALGWIRETAAPLKESDVLPLILSPLQSDPFFAVLIAALLTWMAHSSLAIVLILMSFVAAGTLPLMLGLYMVLGANLGGTIPPILATLKDHPQALRISVSNMLVRVTGVILVFPFMEVIEPYIAMIDADHTREIVNFHTAFNVVLALSFLPFTGVVTRLAKKIIPDRVERDDPKKSRYLDVKDLNTPSVALAAATRETLRMADIVQQMLEDTITVLRTNDMKLLEKVSEEDNTIDEIYGAIKAYMAKLSQEFMDPKEAQRYVQILTFATNIEHAGDVIDRNLMPVALKKIKQQTQFSEEGFKDIKNIHELVLASVQLAQSVFVSGDLEMAKRLLEDKQVIREEEISGMASHIERLSEGLPDTIATSTLHLDIVRDYRRINTYMCTVAYPLLEQAGERHTSRLKLKK